MTIKRLLATATTLAAAMVIAVPSIATAIRNQNLQHTKLPLTLAGHTFLYRVHDFTVGGTPVHNLVLIHQFSKDGRRLTFTEVSGPAIGPVCENETAHITQVGRGLYFVRWIEKSGIVISGVHNLTTGDVQQWFVLPPSVTGAPGAISVSPTGTYTRYTGHTPARCTNNGSGQ